MYLLELNFEDLERPKLTNDDFEKFQDHYKIHVPDDLKELFVKMNSCILDYPIVKCESIGGGVVMPEHWVGIAQNGMGAMLDLYGNTIGDNALPFCRDPGGNPFTIVMDGTEQQGVYYVDLDDRYPDGEIMRYRSHWLAHNLQEFADKITYQ